MIKIPIEVKNNFLANIIPGKTILYTIYMATIFGCDVTSVKFYLVVDKTSRTVKVVHIGEKIVQARSQNNYKVVADPINRDKTIISLWLSSKSLYNDYCDIYFFNTRLRLKDLKIYNGQSIQVKKY